MENMSYSIKQVDLNIYACKDVDLSMKHGIGHKKQGDLS